MSTIMELMLEVREGYPVYYHKETNQFDHFPYVWKGLEELDENARIPMQDSNNIQLPTYEEIDHKENMRYYVRECVEDKAIRKQLFDILRRREYMDAFLDKLRELDLYEDFTNVCMDVYIQIFWEWADKNGLKFN